jgi:hypothetical protein
MSTNVSTEQFVPMSTQQRLPMSVQSNFYQCLHNNIYQCQFRAICTNVYTTMSTKLIAMSTKLTAMSTKLTTMSTKLTAVSTKLTTMATLHLHYQCQSYHVYYQQCRSYQCLLPTMSILPMSTARRACQIVNPTKCQLLGVHVNSSIMIEAMGM